MNQKSNYFLSILSVSLFSYSSGNAMLTSVFKPAVKNIAKEQDPEIAKIKRLATIADVDHEIDTLKNDILNEYLMELKTLTKLSYDDIKTLVQDKRTVIRKRLQKHNPQMHDPNIPSSMYKDIQTVMSDENVNPQNIRLEYKNNSHDGRFADTVDGYFSGLAPRIRIYTSLLRESKTNQNFIYRHELQHIFLMHSSITMTYYNYGVHNSHKLLSIEEREADMHAASKNSQMAYTGMLSRCNIGHAHIINKQSHCKDMQLMYALMKQKEQLS